jgi:hypothetical protein
MSNSISNPFEHIANLHYKKGIKNIREQIAGMTNEERAKDNGETFFAAVRILSIAWGVDAEKVIIDLTEEDPTEDEDC